jgi:ABC-2 type transport system ATP-binding protein
MNAVNMENLRKSFELSVGKGLKRTKSVVEAVAGITLQVPYGQSVAFIGPNGAGKSTTIKMLTGILRPTSGLIEVVGLNPWSQRSKLARKIGVVFGQRSQLWYHLPPEDTFELLGHIYELPSKEFKVRRDMLIERFALQSFLKTPVRKLSLGQRMRSEIAASLLHKPELIFLDEPTIGLDVIARQELRDIIREWNREEGATVFLTSHDAGDIEAVAERVIIVNHGKVVLDDTIANMRRDYLNSKLLSVVFHERPSDKSLPGVKVLKFDDFSRTFEVDTRVTAIPHVISEVMKLAEVADVSIEDPPLEDVIAHIYSSAPAMVAS